MPHLLDMRTGRLVNRPSSPTPGQLAREMADALARQAPADHQPFNRLSPVEQSRWVRAAQQAIGRLRL